MISVELRDDEHWLLNYPDYREAHRALWKYRADFLESGGWWHTEEDRPSGLINRWRYFKLWYRLISIKERLIKERGSGQ